MSAAGPEHGRLGAGARETAELGVSGPQHRSLRVGRVGTHGLAGVSEAALQTRALGP